MTSSSSPTIRVGVVGAAGKMGATVCQVVRDASDLELTARIDPSVAPGEHDELAVTSLRDVDPSTVDVVVDFTVLDVSREVLAWCASNAVHAVVGTTGFDDDDLARFQRTFTQSNALIAPNFAIGAVMMMRMAELAAPHFDTAEVIEFHHNAKKDAPSGTAMMTVQRMAAARAKLAWEPDPTEHEVVARARGGDVDGIGVHSVRMKGMVAHQEVILGTLGETLTIRHDSIERSSFMPGVLLAVREVGARPGLTLGLDPLLFD